MSYLHEPNNHPALTDDENLDYPEMPLEGPEDVMSAYEFEHQEEAVIKSQSPYGYTVEYIIWLEELAFKQLTK